MNWNKIKSSYKVNAHIKMQKSKKKVVWSAKFMNEAPY